MLNSHQVCTNFLYHAAMQQDCLIKHDITHHIGTAGTLVSARPQRFAPEWLKMARQEFGQMLELWIIWPSSSSWSSLLHMVTKKSGVWCPCSDYSRGVRSTAAGVAMAAALFRPWSYRIAGSFARENFRELLKVGFLRLKLLRIVGNENNAWAGGDERDWIGENKISELQSYEVLTVDRGYHVYIAVWEAAVLQIATALRVRGKKYQWSLRCCCCRFFGVKTFANCPETAKLAKVFTSKNSRYTVYN